MKGSPMMKQMRAITVCLVASAVALAPATTSMAADNSYAVSATPTTGLKTGDTVTLSVAGLSGSLGVYASVCQAGQSPFDPPTLCDQSSTVWVTSGALGSSKSPTAITVRSAFDGKTSPSAATSTAVNCVTASCVIYVRGDHNNSGNYSLIRTVALKFTTGGLVKTPDTATATYGTVTLLPNQAGQLAYRTPIKLKIKSTSRLNVTLTSLTPDCAVNGNVVTALKGTGVCAIAATTKGSFAYSPLFVNFPFYLNPAVQTILARWPKPLTRKVGSTISIPATDFATNMEQPVTLSTSSANCVVASNANGWSVQFTGAGTCILSADADAKTGKWGSANATAIYTVR
jgi:hypothetical protein